MIQIQKQMERLILDKEKAIFNSRKMMQSPSLYQEQFSSISTSFISQKTKETEIKDNNNKVSRDEFLQNVLLIENNGKRSNHKNLLIEEITKEWKELAGKIRMSCKFEFKFEPEKYRVGSHSFRYTTGKNEIAWNTALKFMFNNAKKLIFLQEKMQSLEIFKEF